MKVLQVIGVLNKGGAETLLMNVFENIDRKIYDFDFLVFEDMEYPYTKKVLELGGNIVYLPDPKKVGMFKFIKSFKLLCKENNYEVVHAHTLFNCGPCMLGAFLAGVKVRISHSHSTKYLEESISLKKRIYYILSKILINIFSTDCLACGEAAGKFLYFKQNKVKIIRNGINVNKYLFNESSRYKIRELYKIGDKDFVIGHVGRLMYIKNQKFLLEIFAEIYKKHKNTFLILVGDGELRKEYVNMVHELKLEKNVIFAGNVDNVNEYYSSFDLFVFPSLFEGVPFTLIEAQTNGLEIIASDKISAECNISNTIEFADINDKEYWVKAIEKKFEIYKRYDNIEYVNKNGYSIKDTVDVLSKIYFKK